MRMKLPLLVSPTAALRSCEQFLLLPSNAEAQANNNSNSYGSGGQRERERATLHTLLL